MRMMRGVKRSGGRLRQARQSLAVQRRFLACNAAPRHSLGLKTAILRCEVVPRTCVASEDAALRIEAVPRLNIQTPSRRRTAYRAPTGIAPTRFKHAFPARSILLVKK